MLEERVDYQELAVRKLRGRVTGSLRRGIDDAASDESLPNPPSQRGNPQALELLAKRNRAIPR